MLCGLAKAVWKLTPIEEFVEFFLAFAGEEDGFGKESVLDGIL